MKRVAIYSRKSKETEKGESINNQIQMCKNYFLSKSDDYEFEVFQDEGFSGGNSNRPQFQRMILLASHKKFDIVACYKIDRIARNIIDFMNTFDILQKNEVSLVSITEGFDPSTPMGMMMMTMLAGFAEMERMNIAQRVKDNMVELAKLGRWSGGTPPTGYKSIDVIENSKRSKYLELDTSYVDTIKVIYEKISSGYSTVAVSKLINMPNKTILNIVRNPVYCKSDLISKDYLEKIGYTVIGDVTSSMGYMPYNRRSRKKDGKKETKSKEMFVTVSKHEGVIQSSLWISANKRLDDRKIASRPRISTKSFLAQMVKCKCGSGMYINLSSRPTKDGKLKNYFQCSARRANIESCDARRIEVSLLESDVLELLKKLENNKKLLSQYISASTPKEENLNEDIKNIKNIIKKYNSDINNLTEKLLLLNDNAANIIVNKINTLSDELEMYNEQLLKLETRKILVTGKVVDIDSLSNKIKSSLRSWDNIDISDKQIFIQNIIKEIQWIGGDDFKVIFVT